MLLFEENHEGASTSTQADNNMLCTEVDRPCYGWGLKPRMAPPPPKGLRVSKREKKREVENDTKNEGNKLTITCPIRGLYNTKCNGK